MPPTATLSDIKAHQQRVEKNEIVPDNMAACPRCHIESSFFRTHAYRERRFLIIKGWGVFNLLDLPGWLVVWLSVMLLDLIIYLQHVMFHALPVLWRLHRVHHADRDFDTTTGLRFHSIEIFLSTGIKISAIALIGAPPVAVLIFEVLLNATAMFNHGNVSLPSFLDRMMRMVVVTPGMHRVHHSVIARETNSNYGFNLPWWDCLCGTYRAQPAKGHLGMTIGLSEYQTTLRAVQLPWMLALPFWDPLDSRSSKDNR